jgi:diguanylate cyclase (GGDEF)-like protein
MGDDRSIDDLRAEALDAARGMVQGEQALAEALRSIREESERATEAYRAVVRSLATALAARDGYTGAHSDIVHDLSVQVARRLGLEGPALADVAAAALLHDVGKIGIPDHVLHKHGPLDELEWALMREHPVIGDQILRQLPGLAAVADAVRHEHERWDGRGYPDGLAGEAIPLASRIVLACDAYSALVSDRPYRPALSVAEATAELERCAGSQFDPDVVTALLDCLAPDGTIAGAVEPVEAGPRSQGQGPDALRLEREVAALIAVASAVATVETLDDLVEVTAQEARWAIDAASLSVARWEPDHLHERVIVNVGDLAEWEERRPADEIYRIDHNEALRRVIEGRSYVTTLDSGDGLDEEHEILRSVGKYSSIAVPIVLGGKPWGEIWGARRSDQPPFDDRDVRFLQTIAGQVAAAVGRAELFARMADLAFRDPLTGVGNRRALEERLEVAVQEALAIGRDLALVLCDVDNLKELNDVLGHQSGDEALKRVAAALVAEAGTEIPLVYRIGGDELCLVLDGHGADEAVAVGERVLRRLSEQEGALTVSLGVASLAMGVEKAADLLRAADAAQYTAKRNGRGRICLADPHPTTEWRRPRAAADEPRRRFRDEAPDVVRLAEDALAALDGPLARAEVQVRLEDLLSRLVAGLDAARGAVSICPLASGTIDALFTLDARRGRVWRSGLGQQSEMWRLEEYPSTARILSGGSFVVRADDPAADDAEREVLAEFGMNAVLAAAATTADGTGWLLELYADGDPSNLDAAEAVTRLLVREAVARDRDLGLPRVHAVA